MKQDPPLTLPDEKQPVWLLSTLQSDGSSRTSAFRGKITIPSQLRLSPDALKAVNQQLSLLGGDRHVFDFSAVAQGVCECDLFRTTWFM
jgi:hypothetical protein